MREIIKSQVFQLKRDKLIWIIFGSIAAVMLYLMVMKWFFIPKDCSGSMFAIEFEHDYYCVLFVMLSAVYFMGRDYVDRTIHLDVMYGYDRKLVFWGRVLPTLIWTMITSIILSMLVPVVSTILWGWGDKITITEFLYRLSIYGFVIFRVISVMILLVVVTGSLTKSYILGVLLGYVSYNMIKNIFYRYPAKNYIPMFGVKSEIFTFESFHVHHINGEDEQFYEYILSENEAFKIAAISVLIGIICLSIAAHYFKIQDINEGNN